MKALWMLGLLTLAVGGGALGGYLMRARQEAVSRQKEAAAIGVGKKPVIETKALEDDAR